MQLGLFDGAMHILTGGVHYRIPDPTDPERCRCGEPLAAPATTHDRAHDAYVRSLGALLAPASCR